MGMRIPVGEGAEFIVAAASDPAVGSTQSLPVPRESDCSVVLFTHHDNDCSILDRNLGGEAEPARSIRPV
jgi:hypothetical protein